MCVLFRDSIHNIFCFSFVSLVLMKTLTIVSSTTAPSHHCLPILECSQTLSVAIDEFDLIHSPTIITNVSGSFFVVVFSDWCYCTVY